MLDDVQQEKLTAKYAREEYGVVVDAAAGELDAAATERL